MFDRLSYFEFNFPLIRLVDQKRSAIFMPDIVIFVKDCFLYRVEQQT